MIRTIKAIFIILNLSFLFVITSFASVYSPRWETQADGSWMYRMDAGGYATNKWLQDEVDKNWYLMDENGIMLSGIYKSYDRYYLLSEIHDGHFGHLVKNGEVYQGITIKADTSSDYEGALSAETIQALKAIGFKFETVKDISGTSHVTDGKVSFDAGNANTNVTSHNQNNGSSKINDKDIEKDPYLKELSKDPDFDYEAYKSVMDMFSSAGTTNMAGRVDMENQGNIQGQ